MSIILNKAELLQTNAQLRGPALEILEAGLEAINTEKILRKKLRVENGKLFIKNNSETIVVSLPSPSQGEGQSDASRTGWGRVYFIGIGKCALDGAKVIEDILGDYLTSGMVIDVKDKSEAPTLKKTQYFQGTHPLPSEQNIFATKEILKMVEGVTEKDLIITLISGGGSALFELPIEGVTLDDIIEKTRELTAKGADIYELNQVRKSMSQVKGGKFAELCFPAQMISLLFSDVLGNDISVIASGPTVLPSPSQGEGLGGGVVNILIASNHDALLAMKNKAEEFGFNTTIETEKFAGNASELGKELASRVPKSKTCILLGGETTVRIPQTHGIGGRNQEMALSALLHIPADTLLVCVASDGFDNTDHAGAFADLELLQKIKNMGIFPESFLLRGDSYNFFKKISDGVIYTGKLGSNVSDLCIMLYK